MNVRWLATLTSCALGAATFFSTSSAHAYEPGQVHEGASIGALIGFGENEFLFNTGIRGGYTLPAHVYLGGTFLFNAGTAGYYGCGYGYGCNTGTVGFTTGFEAGYEFPAGPLTVRPYGGIGGVLESYSGGAYGQTVCINGVCTTAGGNAYGSFTTTSVALWAGGTAIYDFKNHGPWFVMGDVRVGDAPFLVSYQVMGWFMVGGGYEF